MEQYSYRSRDGVPVAAGGPGIVGKLEQGFQLFRLTGLAVCDGGVESGSE